LRITSKFVPWVGAAGPEVRRLAGARAVPWQSRQPISIAFATSP
jgi:hypothetical protein